LTFFPLLVNINKLNEMSTLNMHWDTLLNTGILDAKLDQEHFTWKTIPMSASQIPNQTRIFP